jgi:hypothetical protein
MIDPHFDPMAELHACVLAVYETHRQLDLFIKMINDHNTALLNINNALSLTKKQLVFMEARLYDLEQTAAIDSLRR